MFLIAVFCSRLSDALPMTLSTHQREGFMNDKLIISLALILGVSSVFATQPTAGTHQTPDIIAKPIPPGYHFPVSTAIINKWIAIGDTKAMRRHMWDVWSGVTADSGETYQGKQLPIWETWYGFNEIFLFMTSNQSETQGFPPFQHRGALHAFVEPHQFTHVKTGFSLRKVLGPEQERLMSFNKFSPHAASFIMGPQSGPGGEIYYYNSGPSLVRLNTAWPTETSAEDRSINQFPVESLVAKPVFGIVKATGLTPLPLWQGLAGSTNPVNPTQDTWKTCVLVDPKGEGNQLRPATESEIASAHKSQGLSCQTYLYGPLSTLYWFKLTSDEAATFRKARNGGVDTGDYAVLVAIHFNTRETPFWTWHTFYWQPGADTPDEFPGTKADQPKNLQAPWNNYAACANYNQTTTLGGSTMDVCFNPYLETTPGIPSGISSNCMSCHGVARMSSNPGEVDPYPADYKTPIAFFSDPRYFNSSTTHTEFSWAIAGSAFIPPTHDGMKINKKLK